MPQLIPNSCHHPFLYICVSDLSFTLNIFCKLYFYKNPVGFLWLAHPSVPFGEWFAQCDGHWSSNKEPRHDWDSRASWLWLLGLNARPMAPPNPCSSGGRAVSHSQGTFPRQSSNNLTRYKYNSYSFCFLHKLLVNDIIKCSWL